MSYLQRMPSGSSFVSSSPPQQQQQLPQQGQYAPWAGGGPPVNPGFHPMHAAPSMAPIAPYTPPDGAKKRKTNGAEPSTSAGTSVSAHRPQPSTASNHSSNEDTSPNDAPKRIKTARACDSCRRKKIRCDVIDDGSPPPGDPNNGNGGLTCAHCRQYGFSCTFFLPITETRFKKKREREAEEAAARSAAAVAHYGGAMGMMRGAHMGMPLPPPPPASISAAQEWPLPRVGPSVPHYQAARLEPGLASPKSSSMPPPIVRQASPRSSEPPNASGATTSDVGIPPDSRVMGPTSLAYIVHSTAFIPGSAIEAHDLKHSQTFEVGASGDGIIKLNRLRPRNASCTSSGDDEAALPQIPDAIRGRLAGDVAEKLINSYFERIGYLCPIVTKSEFLHLARPPPLLFYAICGAAALDRNVPREVLSAVRIGLNAIFKDSDVLSSSSANTVKALLILSLHADIHGSTNVQSGSRMWNRLGVGLRMAQDLGLHRDASRRDDLDEFAHFLEQKRRIWGACVTADRLVSIALGHPLAIDLTDCDVRLPSPYEVLRYPTDLPTRPGEDQPFAFNTEMLKLAILFGRVQKTIYGPTGLMKATDEEITGLLSDIDQWRDSLPEKLRYVGPTSSASAGILHLAFSCLQMLFFRVFMRISYSCPQHLKFSLTIERMTSLIRWSRESIAWVDTSGAFYLDTMQFVSYALVFCAMVQYHSRVRRGDEEGLKSLSQIKDIVSRGRLSADDRKQDLSLRAKTAEIISLLHESASGQWANTPSTGSLNPTAGVVNRRTTESVKGIIWRDAPGRPGGGAYEASEPHLLLADLPPGTIILGSNRTPALVRSASGWQQVPGGLPEQAGRGHGGGTGSGGAAEAMSNSASTTGSSAAGTGEPLPDLSNFTHLGGSVWQDEQGWPVDRRGSGLMVVLPQNGNGGGFGGSVPGGSGFMMNAQNAANFMNGYGNGGNFFNNFMAGANGQNVNPQLNGASQQGLDGGAAQDIDGLLAASASNGILPNAPMGGSQQQSQQQQSVFGFGQDPLMLNDPLMGILDWQAWQTYLAPAGQQQQQQQGEAGAAGLDGDEDGGEERASSAAPPKRTSPPSSSSRSPANAAAAAGPQSQQQQQQKQQRTPSATLSSLS